MAIGTRYPGPCEIDCYMHCTVPSGAALIERVNDGAVVRTLVGSSQVGDIINCPNSDCGRSFRIERDPRQA